MSSVLTAAEIARDARWLVQAFDPSAHAVRLVNMDAEAYRRASFLDDRLLQSQVQAVIRPWEEVAAAATLVARQDARWIFHVGHVGSTLVARLLGELESVLSVREPRILRDLTVVGAAQRVSMMPAIRTLMSRTFDARQSALIKVTSFVSELAPELVPDGGRALFIHAGPRAYIETILAGPNSRVELRHLAETRRRRSAGRINDLPAPANDADLAAHAWACEMTALEQAAEHMADRSIAWLDFDDFLADMPQGLRHTAEQLGFSFDPDDLDAVATGPLTRRYSKALEYDYSPALRAELRAEARREHGREIAEALSALEDLADRSPLLRAALERTRREN